MAKKYQLRELTEFSTISYIQVLKKHKGVIERYATNMMLGVGAGMVRSVEVCQAARMSFQSRFPKISEMGFIGKLLFFTRFLI